MSSVQQLARQTSLSQTVGTKSYPMPSTSYTLESLLFKSSGCAIMEPTGSTPIIYIQQTTVTKLTIKPITLQHLQYAVPTTEKEIGGDEEERTSKGKRENGRRINEHGVRRGLGKKSGREGGKRKEETGKKKK